MVFYIVYFRDKVMCSTCKGAKLKSRDSRNFSPKLFTTRGYAKASIDMDMRKYARTTVPSIEEYRIEPIELPGI
jgi:hypothetical protein